jgi:HSP20 family molecular chaperone IbpA
MNLLLWYFSRRKNRMKSLMERYIDEAYQKAWRPGPDFGNSVSCKWKQTKEGLSYEMEIPGAGEDDVSVEASDGFLFIHAEANGRDVERTYSIPRGYDPKDMKASVKNGILTIILDRGEKTKIL